MNNLWNDYLTALGYSGSVPDMIVRALRERVEPTPLSGTVNDLWHQYLSGSTGVQHGTIDDLMARHLRGLGYSGAVPDMLKKSLIAGDFFAAAVDKSQLDDALANADALNEDDYTPESWQSVEDAVAAGQQVADDPNATQEQVDDATQAIADALAALVPVAESCTVELTHDIVAVDPSYLPADINGQEFSITFPTPGFDQYAASTSISDLKSLPASGTVWVEFRRSGVPAGVGFQFADAVSTAAINFISFDDGFGGVELYEGGSFVGGAQLGGLGSISSLMAGFNAAGELFVMDQYGVPRNVTEFPVDNSPLPTAPLSGFTAIAFVGGIIGSTELTGTASGQFVTDHEQFPYPPEGEAYDWCGNALPPKYDRDDLQQALNVAASLDAADFTPESWQEFQDIVDVAQNVYDDPAATPEEVTQATSELNWFMEYGLVPVADKAALSQAIADAEALNEEDYTPESWALLEGALIAGHQVNDDPNATQEQVDDATQDISNAISELTSSEVITCLLRLDQVHSWHGHSDGVVQMEPDGQSFYMPAGDTHIPEGVDGIFASSSLYGESAWLSPLKAVFGLRVKFDIRNWNDPEIFWVTTPSIQLHGYSQPGGITGLRLNADRDTNSLIMHIGEDELPPIPIDIVWPDVEYEVDIVVTQDGNSTHSSPAIYNVYVNRHHFHELSTTYAEGSILGVDGTMTLIVFQSRLHTAIQGKLLTSREDINIPETDQFPTLCEYLFPTIEE